MRLLQTCIHLGHKKIIFGIICIFLIIGFKMCFHFKINPENIILRNIEFSDGEMTCDVTLRVGFYDVTDYSTEIKNNRLYINFYGSYPFLKLFYNSVNEITVKTPKKINYIIGKNGNKEIIWWKANTLSE